MVVPLDPHWTKWPIAEDSLATEFLSAFNRLEPREVDWICRACQALPADLVNVGGVVVQEIEPFGDGTYQPSKGGMDAFIVCAFAGPAPSPRNATASAVYGGGVEVIDLVAWNPSKTSRWWCREGGAAFLGANAYEVARFCHRRPVRVFRSPASWIREGGDLAGVVVLDWAAAGFDLRDLPGVVAEDTSHGREVERRMRQPIRPSPPVLVEMAV